MTKIIIFSEKEKKAVLKRFMIEFFPFTPLRKAGLFTPEMKGDYAAQAERVCKFLGYETVYEYGSKEVLATCLSQVKRIPTSHSLQLSQISTSDD
ncbi:hypothetical protein LZD49_26310 [Dyadobacter sp. CY261]|uniref:hypothetical protein n=1 Tax=Dyadobacter sp. CY261 TaxID=2907203 RepID=UPI001F30ABA4|nr:hypothetical protein [Dyadobacter sp. CY261]MCF0074023.1 hypothetical protein [Dyadobacter sp. CY261]